MGALGQNAHIMPADEELLLIGVLSTASLMARRELVRASWGRSASPRTSVVALNFLLAEDDAKLESVASEQRTHEDLYFAPGVRASSYFYAEKLFVWLSHAVRTTRSEYVAFADDDGEPPRAANARPSR